MAVQVRSNAVDLRVEHKKGITAGDAMAEAHVRKSFLGKKLVNGKVATRGTELKDGDGVTVSPRSKNG